MRSTADQVLPARRSPPANNARDVTSGPRRSAAAGASPPNCAFGTTGETRCKSPGAYLSDDKNYQTIHIVYQVPPLHHLQDGSSARCPPHRYIRTLADGMAKARAIDEAAPTGVPIWEREGATFRSKSEDSLCCRPGQGSTKSTKLWQGSKKSLNLAYNSRF